MERSENNFDILYGLDPADRFDVAQLEAEESCIIETDDGWFSFRVSGGGDARSAAPIEVTESTIPSIQPGEALRIDGAMVAGLVAPGIIGRDYNLAFTKFIRYDITPEDIAAMGEQAATAARRSGSIMREDGREYMIAWDGIWRHTPPIRNVFRSHKEGIPSSVFAV